VHFFNGRLDDQIHLLQRHVSGRGRDAIEPGPGFDAREGMSLDRLLVKVVDRLHAAPHLGRVNVFEYHRMFPRADPLGDACAHDARANHCDAIDRSDGSRCRHLGRNILRAFLKEKDANQIFARGRFCQFEHRVHFKPK